jgi:hypothetical protein
MTNISDNSSISIVKGILGKAYNNIGIFGIFKIKFHETFSSFDKVIKTVRSAIGSTSLAERATRLLAGANNTVVADLPGKEGVYQVRNGKLVKLPDNTIVTDLFDKEPGVYQVRNGKLVKLPDNTIVTNPLGKGQGIYRVKEGGIRIIAR